MTRETFTIPNVAYLDFNPSADRSHPLANTRGTVTEVWENDEIVETSFTPDP